MCTLCLITIFVVSTLANSVFTFALFKAWEFRYPAYDGVTHSGKYTGVYWPSPYHLFFWWLPLLACVIFWVGIAALLLAIFIGE